MTFVRITLFRLQLQFHRDLGYVDRSSALFDPPLLDEKDLRLADVGIGTDRISPDDGRKGRRSANANKFPNVDEMVGDGAIERHEDFRVAEIDPAVSTAARAPATAANARSSFAVGPRPNQATRRPAFPTPIYAHIPDARAVRQPAGPRDWLSPGREPRHRYLVRRRTMLARYPLPRAHIVLLTYL
jgi:hypothetical protein